MGNPNLVLPNGPTDESLMEKLMQNMPNTPGDVEKASNPSSILNDGGATRRHGDLVKHPLTHSFTRSPRPQGPIKVPGAE